MLQRNREQSHRATRLHRLLLGLLAAVGLGAATSLPAGADETPAPAPSAAATATATCVTGCGVPDCEKCGAFTAGCSTQVIAEVMLKGKSTQHVLCCLNCLNEELTAWGDSAKLIRLKVVDYTSVSAGDEQLIDGRHAYYLFDTRDLADGHGAPHIAAFETKAAAQQAQPKLGGTLLSGWNALRAQLEATAKDKDKAKVPAKG